jgi:2-polyprenyl-3-methyl-5-hydroxy-6-metoxy-1,4-benzoquinol methylase
VVDFVTEGYDAVYRAWNSPAFHAIWARTAVDGDIEPGFQHLNFATVGQLQRLAGDLQLRPGERLLDVACGAGGPGLWVARATRAKLLGLDLSSVGTGIAAQRAKRLGIDAEFVAASVTMTGAIPGPVDGAMSIDSLQYVPDKQAAFAEIARTLKPSGRMAFTAFELDAETVTGFPVLGEDPVGDYRPVLEDVGLTVETYEQTPGWEERLTAAYSAVIDAEALLRPEMGDAAMDSYLLEMSTTLALKPYKGRAYVVARKST